MKILFLNQLRLSNFQKFKSEKFQFGQNTIVRGRNAAGKTTIYSALNWLLFDKDADGKTNFDIKRLVNGAKEDKVDVVVEGEFFYGGKPITLKKTLHEKWSKKNDEYIGDETICLINDVPTKTTDYRTFISSIVSEEDFRMMTQIGYFNSLKTEVKRNYLTTMAGVKSAEEICKDNQSWLDLVNKLSGKSFKEALSERIYKRKKLEEEKLGIQPSINALQNSCPEEKGWVELEAKKKALEDEISGIDKQLMSENERKDAENREYAAISDKKFKLEARIRRLENDIVIKKENAKNKAEKDAREKNKKRVNLESELKSIKFETESIENKIKSIETEISALETDMDDLLKKYNNLQEEKFSFDGGICPLKSGFKCDSPKMLEIIKNESNSAEAEYNSNKAKRLNLIIENGKRKKKESDRLKAQKEELSKDLENKKLSYGRMSQDLSNMEVFTPEYKEEPCTEIKDEIKSIEIEISSLDATRKGSVKVDSSLTERKKELNKRVNEIVDQLADRRQIAKIEEDIKKLNQRAKQLSGEITSLKIEEDSIKDINRAITEDANSRINAMFTYVKWRTSVLQKNGLYNDVCEPTIDGVSSSLNSAARINVGIDICDTIMRYRGIQVPLFIDNRESVTEVISTECQTINMFVDPSKEQLEITTNLI